MFLSAVIPGVPFLSCGAVPMEWTSLSKKSVTISKELLKKIVEKNGGLSVFKAYSECWNMLRGYPSLFLASNTSQIGKDISFC